MEINYTLRAVKTYLSAVAFLAVAFLAVVLAGCAWWIWSMR